MRYPDSGDLKTLHLWDKLNARVETAAEKAGTAKLPIKLELDKYKQRQFRIEKTERLIEMINIAMNSNAYRNRTPSFNTNELFKRFLTAREDWLWMGIVIEKNRLIQPGKLVVKLNDAFYKRAGYTASLMSKYKESGSCALRAWLNKRKQIRDKFGILISSKCP